MGERGRWLVVEPGQLHMGWVPLLLKLVSLLLILVPLLLASSRIFVHSVLYMGGVLPGGCITSVLLWEEEWPVFVLPVCRPLAQ